MAKQSFSVGQVLTAAQMNSLQQTAMLGGSATAKTASYTLVAADAGTVVSVNSTSATTITVNTALFSAGDTVTIQNWGTGAVTITAGTATVNTAGSLIVPQYDGGVLYFTSASAAIYFDFVQAGAVSPLTTKGDLYTFSTSDARLPVGTNGHTLVANSSTATGLEWQAPATGGMTSLASGTLSGTELNLSSINQTYNDLVFEIIDANWGTADDTLRIRFNGLSTFIYTSITQGTDNNGTSSVFNGSGSNNRLIIWAGSINWKRTGSNSIYLRIPSYAVTTGRRAIFGNVAGQSASNEAITYWSGFSTDSAAITQITLATSTGYTFSSGSYKLWGVK
jgi:hypothetical protein